MPLDPKRRSEFSQRSNPLENAVVSHVRKCISRDWRMAMLQLDVAFAVGTGIRSIKHRLWNPMTDDEVHDFPETLFQATTALHAVFAEFDQPWTRSLFIISIHNDGRVMSEMNYHYGDPQSG